jgi:hypothetical protein
VSFTILAVRDGEATDDPNYPFPGEWPDSVEPLPDDGNSLDLLKAVELQVVELGDHGPSQLIRVNKMKAAILITEHRVAVACSKYEKGGGWWALSGGMGALAVAGVANTVSKVRAARRRRGKMLVGHVPYVHLMSVGFRPPSGVKQREQLRLTMYDPTHSGYRGLALDMTLSGNPLSASFLAQQIACWAASAKLNADDQPSDAERAMLEPLLDPDPLVPQAREFSSYRLVPDGFTP